ncbi:MAG: ATP-binding protein [Candidatus Melainabacteria bacterium]|nr:ATP-binding protein [Candidatus Melainabacteria bacterium]
MQSHINRKQKDRLIEFINSDVYKVALVYGARRLGKTTLVEKYLADNKLEHLFIHGDMAESQEILSSQSGAKLKSLIGKHKLVFLDEAQRIENIGFSLKILVDTVPDLKIIATGSSSLDLGKKIGEPLGGRATTIKLYPIAQEELVDIESSIETQANLEDRLIYGSYPVVITNPDKNFREQYLLETIDSYLLKDILEFDGIRNSNKIKQLLTLIAFQIGKEVSLTELGSNLGINKDTVAKYLDLLEKAFVIYSRQGFSRNLRSEITRNYHYYFYDNGIRNALIRNFNGLNLRDDLGMLWENYITTERLKHNDYSDQILPNSYFWRTYEQQEIDLIEESSGELAGYEIKYKQTKEKSPPQWRNNYPEASFKLINKENYLEFIT